MEKNDFDYFEKIKKDFLVSDATLFKFGSIGDGGYYLRPDTIKKSNVLFSGGISSNLEFEYDLFRFNNEIKLIMIDPTISQTKLLFKGIARLFFKKPEKIRYLINVLMFSYLIRSPRSVHMKLWLNKEQSIFKILKSQFNIENRVLLKLDIESSEYDFLEEITGNLKAFSAMVFEFHDLDKNHKKVYDFLHTCSSQFKMVHLSVNPSGGFDKYKRPRNIEVSLERLDV